MGYINLEKPCFATGNSSLSGKGKEAKGEIGFGVQ